MEIRMSKKWLIAIASTLLFAPTTWGLGIGEIDIKSKLNQPLDAEIQITSASSSELRDVVFSIPNADVFARYNLDRPQVLNSVRFVVENRDSGNKVIRLASSQVVKDPFLTFLIQADWPQGRMLREYTVLVDPPLFVPNKSAAQTQAYVDNAVVSNRATTNSQGSIDGRNEASNSGRASNNLNSGNYARANAAGDSYRVKRGDTLWEIANSIKPDDSFSVNQTMIAIFRNNPEAFDGNINRLKAGQVLSVPTRNQINTLSQESANQVVRTQTRDWRDNTRDSRATSTSTTKNASSSGSNNTGNQTVSPESKEGRLELKVPNLDAESESTGVDAKQEGLGGSNVDSQVVSELQAKVDEFERLLSAKDNELALLQQELAKARTQEGTESQNTETGEVEAAVIEGTETETPVDASESGPDTTTETIVETPVITAPVITTPEVVEPEKAPLITTPEEDKGDLFSLLKKIAIGLGLALLGLFGFLFIRNRNSGPSHDTLFVDEDLDTTVEDIAERVKTKIGNKYSGTAEVEILKEPVPSIESDDDQASSEDESIDIDFGSEDVGDTAEVGIITETIESDEALPFDDTTLADVSMGSMEMDANDPIAETDFHMAYGLYDQAADIMSTAITETDDFKFKDKLLEVYFVSGNKEEFSRYAAEIQDEAKSGHPSSWENIIIMGKQIAPENSLFSGDVGSAGIDEGLDFSLDQTGQIDVDQSLFSDLEEFSEPEADEAEAKPASDEVIDLDFSDPSDEVIDLDFSDPLDDVIDLDFSESSDEVIDLDFSDPAEASPDHDILGLDLSENLEVESNEFDDDLLDISLSLDLPEAPVDLEGVIENFGSDLDASLNGPISSELQSSLQDKIESMPESEVTKEINVEDLLDLDIGSVTGISEQSDVLDETLDFSLDFDSADDLPSDGLNLDFSDETQSLSDDFLDKLDNDDTRTQEMKIDENFDLLLGAGDDETGVSELDLDLETLLSGDDDPFPDDTKRSMLPDGVGDADSGTMSLSALSEEKKLQLQELGEVLNPDDSHASTAQISDEELAAMGLSDDGPELMGVTGLAFDDSDDVDAVSTKLDLARAYIEMDDPENAKSILQEVIEEGDFAQQGEAKDLIAIIS